MHPCLIGVDHTNASVDIRGRFSFTDSQKIEFTALALDENISEIVILSTCNRSEICFVCNNPQTDIPRFRELLLDYLDARRYSDYLFTLCGFDAVKHLFNVACGLSSAIVGEDQILGQVRNAFFFSSKIGACGKLLNKLFREAMTVAKKVKTEFKLSQIPLSVGYIGVKLLSEQMGGLKGKCFMLVGFGEINRLSLKYLDEEQASTVYICSRSGSMPDFSVNIPQLEPVDFYDRYDVLNKVDAVITATSSPHVIFREAEMPIVKKPLYFLDIAVPQDVENGIGKLENCRLFNIDDLKKVSEENMEKRHFLAEKAQSMVTQAAEETMDWILQSRVDPTICSLNKRCSEIASDTTDILFSKLDLTDREKKLVSKMVASSLHRLVREPVIKLKELKSECKQDEYVKVLEELFDLDL